jgi:hypothetical protein
MNKMTPAKARELRDAGGQRPRPGVFMPQPGTQKHRGLWFASSAQAAEALELLGGLDNMAVEPGHVPQHISIWYDLNDYTLAGIVDALARQGFQLDDSLYSRCTRALIAFCEETQLRNLHGPQRLIKKSQDIYFKAWTHHPHGDHDDTPPELRQDK